ncbi:MAG: phosphatidylglycerophosphatase A [Rickettsiaceae bacterium]|nr:phosphatidylglycerophosphatase A [Rickettsiaceae bacterium]
MINIKNIAKFFATFSYLGNIKYMPGTFGSLAAFPLCYIIMYFILNYKVIFSITGFSYYENQIINMFVLNLIATILIFIIGTYFTTIYLKTAKSKDPKEVVIDEVAGQMLAITLSSFSTVVMYGSNIEVYLEQNILSFLNLFLIPFLLFRLFDILKPWPINWFDQNIKGAWGVMLDDIAAAIFASVVHYVIIFFIIDLLN